MEGRESGWNVERVGGREREGRDALRWCHFSVCPFKSFALLGSPCKLFEIDNWFAFHHSKGQLVSALGLASALFSSCTWNVGS